LGAGVAQGGGVFLQSLADFRCVIHSLTLNVIKWMSPRQPYPRLRPLPSCKQTMTAVLQ
jgi:hypothetical protein